MIRFALILAVLPTLAKADLQMTAQRFVCERGVEVPVVTVSAGEESVLVLTVEGRQISLYAEPVTTGVRYAWPSDGSGYVWENNQSTATLFWKNETGEETPVLKECKVVN